MWSAIIQRYRPEAKQISAQMLAETAEENFFRSLLCITEKPSIKKEQALDIWLSAAAYITPPHFYSPENHLLVPGAISKPICQAWTKQPSGTLAETRGTLGVSFLSPPPVESCPWTPPGGLLI